MQTPQCVEFEFDPDKSATNVVKHGLDFVAAQQLWDDSDLLILPSRYPDEPRFLAIGQLGGKLWSAIFTEREDSIRLISVRRARDNERNLYEQNRSR